MMAFIKRHSSNDTVVSQLLPQDFDKFRSPACNCPELVLLSRKDSGTHRELQVQVLEKLHTYMKCLMTQDSSPEGRALRKGLVHMSHVLMNSYA